MKFAFNPLGDPFDLVNDSAASSDDNFSYKKIESGETKTIPLNQQMLVDGDVRVLGDLRVLGSMVDISQRGKDEFFYTLIGAGESVLVKQNRMLLYKNDLRILGNLTVLGSLEVV
jgi:hypothetical protein